MPSVYEEDRASPMGEGWQCDRFQLNIINIFFLIRTVTYEMCDTAGREILLGTGCPTRETWLPGSGGTQMRQWSLGFLVIYHHPHLSLHKTILVLFIKNKHISHVSHATCVSCSPEWAQSCHVDEGDLELPIFLSAPTSWGLGLHIKDTMSDGPDRNVVRHQ